MRTRRTRPKRSGPTDGSPRRWPQRWPQRWAQRCTPRCTPLVATLLLVASAAPTANAQETPAPLTVPQRMAFAVMDEIDGFDTSKLPFVRVSWQPRQRANRAFRYGFLVRHENGLARIRHLDGSHSTIATAGTAADDTASGTGSAGRVTTIDLRELVERMLTQAVLKRDDYPEVLTLRLFFLARIAARRDHLDLVHRIWDVLPDTLIDAYELKKDGSEHALVRTSERRLQRDLCDPEVPFEQAERSHARWLEIFPEVVRGFGGGNKGKARRATAQQTNRLRQQVQARLERIRQTRRSLSSPLPADAPPAQRLVHALPESRSRSSGYRLRYKHPHNHHDAGANASIEDRLVALGLPAVPHLIAALGSKDLTRSCNGENHTLRQRSVGEVAADLLEEIAGYQPRGNDRESAWRDWYADVQERGLRKVLESELRTGNGKVITAYLKRWPEQWARVITIIDKPEKNLSGTIALLNGLPEKLPRQALVACERVFASSIQDVFKEMVGKELAQRLAPNGENALGETLKADTIPAGTKRRLQRLVPGK